MKRNANLVLSVLFALSALSTPLFSVSAEDSQIFSGCRGYSLSSVSLDFVPELARVSAGDKILVRGLATNKSTFAIVGGDILVKIYKIEGDHSSHMVDRFVLPLGVDVSAGKSYAFSFPWIVPSSLENGNYLVTGSFVSASQFSFAEGAWTDSLTGSGKLTVVSPVSGGVYFDTSMGKVNGVLLQNASAFSRDADLVVAIPVTNTTNKEVSVSMKHQIYGGSGISEKSIVDSSVEKIVLARGETKIIPTTIKNTAFAEYHVVLEARYSDVKSVATVSLARGDLTNATIRFVGIEDGKVFGCVSSTLKGISKKMALNIARNDGTSIVSNSFNLGTSTLVGFSQSIPASDSENNLVFSARISDLKNKPLDAVLFGVACKNISHSCSVYGTSSKSKNTTLLMYFMETLVGLAGLALVISRLHYKK